LFERLNSGTEVKAGGHSRCVQWFLTRRLAGCLWFMCRVGQNHIYTVYIRYFGREITKYTITYGAYLRCISFFFGRESPKTRSYTVNYTALANPCVAGRWVESCLVNFIEQPGQDAGEQATMQISESTTKKHKVLNCCVMSPVWVPPMVTGLYIFLAQKSLQPTLRVATNQPHSADQYQHYE